MAIGNFTIYNLEKAYVSGGIRREAVSSTEGPGGGVTVSYA